MAMLAGVVDLSALLADLIDRRQGPTVALGWIPSVLG